VIETKRPVKAPWTGALIVVGAVLLAGCAPTVKIQPPDKPIVINLNVKIEHEVRVRVEKDVDDLLQKDSELF
jgi:hypothetical protein